MNLPGISIVICTYNGKKNLGPTLEHIAAQKHVSNINVELILVDNASTDGTSEFVKNKWESLRFPFDLRIIYENRVGKANASFTGFNASRHELIIVCDDDNWLDVNYVRYAYDCMISNSKIGVLGGKGEPVFETVKPKWFDKQQHIFAVGEQFNWNGRHKGSLWGAGMIFRKNAWDKLIDLNYSFFLNEQRQGKLNWGGDDIELCEMITLLGYELYYDNNLSFKHFIPSQRTTAEYLRSRYFGLGRSRLYLQAYIYCKTNNEIPSKDLKYPLWLDKYIHKSKELLKTLPRILSRMNKETDQEVLNYIALKGELYELWRIKGHYSEIFEKILTVKRKFSEDEKISNK